MVGRRGGCRAYDDTVNKFDSVDIVVCKHDGNGVNDAEFYRFELRDILSLIIRHYYAVNKFDSDVIVVCEYDGDSVDDSMFYWVGPFYSVHKHDSI